MTSLARRRLMAGGVALALSSFTQSPQAGEWGQTVPDPIADAGARTFDPRVIYARTRDNGVELPAINYGKLRPRFYRQIVATPEGLLPETILIKLADHHLYFAQRDGQALRYGIGVGRDGYSWLGEAIIGHQQAWPSWTPPSDMVARLPELAAFRDGMPGGLGNPLGARALYLHRGGLDTLYRIHGTPEWWSIGKSVSSGCIRMINQDVIHLGERVRSGTRVLVS